MSQLTRLTWRTTALAALAVAIFATTTLADGPASAGPGSPDLVVDAVQLHPSSPAQGLPVEVTVTVRNAGGDCTAPCFFTVDFYQHLVSAPGPGDYGEMFCALDIPLAGMTTTCRDFVTYDVSGNRQAWAQVDTDELVTESNEANNVFGPIALNVLADWDGDGVPNASDNCPYHANPAQNLPPWTVPAEDHDCDGTSDANERYLGTDPTARCPDDSSHDAWPPDLNLSQNVSIADVLALKPYFNQSVPPAPARYDLVPSGAISIADVLAIKPYFNLSCDS